MSSCTLHDKESSRVEGNTFFMDETRSPQIDTPALLGVFDIVVALFRIVWKVLLTTD
jgi:hypothetical protein